MDVMELVENEPNARPFRCDWKTCNKVRKHSKRVIKENGELTMPLEL